MNTLTEEELADLYEQISRLEVVCGHYMTVIYEKTIRDALGNDTDYAQKHYSDFTHAALDAIVDDSLHRVGRLRKYVDRLTGRESNADRTLRTLNEQDPRRSV